MDEPNCICGTGTSRFGFSTFTDIIEHINENHKFENLKLCKKLTTMKTSPFPGTECLVLIVQCWGPSPNFSRCTPIW